MANVGVVLNVISRDENVPEIQRHIRTIKVRTSAQYAIQSCITTSGHRDDICQCIVSRGISKTLSPHKFVTGGNIIYKKNCCLEFGSYVKTHESHDNSMLPQAIGAIALRPTGNNQGGHYFFSLEPGRRLNCSKCTSLPMPSDVIKRVHEIAIIMNDMQGPSLVEEFKDHSDSESEIEGVQGQSTIEGVQAQSSG